MASGGPWGVAFRVLLLVGSLGLALAPSRASVAEADIRMPAPRAADEPITPIPPPPAGADSAKVALGARLFADTRLSGDGKRSCLSCHDVRSNGASNRRFDLAPDGHPLERNTPTVFNAVLNFRLNWEGNFRSLEDHTRVSLVSAANMAADLGDVVSRLNDDRQVRQSFEDVYGHKADVDSLLDAIAAYERTLVTPASRFDRWLAGDDTALSPQELAGYERFKSFGCIACHQGANVGGNLFQRYGIFHTLTASGPPMLRVPSLRNVAETAPYFHDGSAPTLEIAVRRMAYAQLDLRLSDADDQAIVAFLKTLTGMYRGRPVHASPLQHAGGGP